MANNTYTCTNVSNLAASIPAIGFTRAAGGGRNIVLDQDLQPGQVRVYASAALAANSNALGKALARLLSPKLFYNTMAENDAVLGAKASAGAAEVTVVGDLDGNLTAAQLSVLFP